MPVFRTELGQGVLRHTPAPLYDSGSHAGPLGSLSHAQRQTLTDRVLALARELGFVRAGVAHLAPFLEEGDRLREFCRRGYAGSMHYLRDEEETAHGAPLRASPARLFPEAQCAVVVALPTLPPRPLRLGTQNPVAEPVAAYAKGADYHHVLKGLLLELADAIAELVGRPLQSRACVDTAPLLERDLAARAGISFTGKNTLSIIPGEGSRFVLGELLLDQPLTPAAATVSDGCGECTACLDVCPTDAFVHAGLLDARACVSYLTIESSEAVPRSLRQAVGGRVFGCDDCQSVCPYNHGKAALRTASPLTARPPWDQAKVDLASLLSITSSAYKRLVRQTALRRISRSQFQRNVAVALGNTPRPESADALKTFLEHHLTGLAAEHAAWALFNLARHHRLPAALQAVAALRDHPSVSAEARHWPASPPGDTPAFQEE